jgi:hypothetical protein
MGSGSNLLTEFRSSDVMSPPLKKGGMIINGFDLLPKYDFQQKSFQGDSMAF